MVKERLLKAMQRKQFVDLMYMSKSGGITKRRVKVINVTNESFHAYCFTKNAKRTFLIENVLSMLPVIRKERAVIS